MNNYGLIIVIRIQYTYFKNRIKLYDNNAFEINSNSNHKIFHIRMKWFVFLCTTMNKERKTKWFLLFQITLQLVYFSTISIYNGFS